MESNRVVFHGSTHSESQPMVLKESLTTKAMILGYPPPTNSEKKSVHLYEGPPINLHFPLLVVIGSNRPYLPAG